MHLRDSEVALYRVLSSRNWQARYRPQTGHRLRFSTGAKASRRTTAAFQWQNNAQLREQAADAVERGGALLDKTLAWSVPTWNLRDQRANHYKRQASCRKSFRRLSVWGDPGGPW